MAYRLSTTGDKNNNSDEEKSVIEIIVIDEIALSSNDSDDNSDPVVPNPETRCCYSRIIGTWRSRQFYWLLVHGDYHKHASY